MAGGALVWRWSAHCCLIQIDNIKEISVSQDFIATRHRLIAETIWQSYTSCSVEACEAQGRESWTGKPGDRAQLDLCCRLLRRSTQHHGCSSMRQGRHVVFYPGAALPEPSWQSRGTQVAHAFACHVARSFAFGNQHHTSVLQV